jgi:hypothetical protein
VSAQRALMLLPGDINPLPWPLPASASSSPHCTPWHPAAQKRASWTINVAAGDSLLYGDRWTRTGERVAHQPWLSTEESWAPPIYALNSRVELQRIRGSSTSWGTRRTSRSYDAELNAVYRKLYTCHRRYWLSLSSSGFSLWPGTTKRPRCRLRRHDYGHPFMTRVGEEADRGVLPVY